MTIWESIAMGIVQGLTEFLPISSSGHLAIAGQLFGIKDPGSGDLFFEIMLHLGTLIAVCFAYSRDIADLIAELFKAVGDIFKGRFSFKNMSDTRRMLVMLVIATLPLFLILPVKSSIEKAAGSLLFVGFALIFTGLLLYISDKIVKGKKREGDITPKNALLVGAFQALATLPGISRSGATITGGLLSGFDKLFAAKFSFIMSIPAILGASILSLFDVIRGESALTASAPVYIAGVLAAAAVGYASIRMLQFVLNKNRFRYFAFYCFAVGAAAVVASFIF